MGIFNIFKSGGNSLKNTQAKKDTSTAKLIPEDRDFILKIVHSFKDQSRKDINKWRQAIQLTQLKEKPRYDVYHDLIDDLSTDGHLQAQIKLFLYAILNTEFSINDDSNKKLNEEATKFFNQKWFYDFLEVFCMAELRGYNLVEFTAFWKDKVEIGVIPQRNIVPQHKSVIPDLSKIDEQIKFDDIADFENWYIEIGGGNLGLLNNIVPNLIWKRNVAQSWAEFTEKYGMPLVTATTNQTDEKKLDKIEFMLEQIGEASTGIFPQGTNVQFHEASRTDAYQTYLNFIYFNREEISVAILGGTMITNDGSSRSQSEVHERNLDEKIAMAVKRKATFLVNDVLVPLLRNQGYSFLKENDRFTFNKSHNLPLDKYWNITKGIMENHEVDEAWLSETFHIPITGKKKINNITSLIDVTALGVTLPTYPDDNCCDHTKFAVSASASRHQKNVQAIHDQLTEDIWNERDTLPNAVRLIAEEALVFISSLLSGWGQQRIDIDYNATDHLLLQMMEQNIIEFATSKTEARLASMTDLMLNREKNQIRSLNEFKAEVDKVTDVYNKTYLETERNHVIATAQNSANYLRFKREAETVTPYVQYQTVGDSKVREEHQLLDGKVFNLNDKEAMRLYPPNGYNCRCEMVQYVGDKSKVISGKQAVKIMGSKWEESEFNYNRAEAMEVFNRSQFYTDDGEILNKINDIDYRSYNGLVSYKEMKGLPKIKLDKTITIKNIKELFRSDGKQGNTDFMGFKDHLNRKIILKNKVFDTHTKGKYVGKKENRHQLFPHIKDVLHNADEMWLTQISKKRYQGRYIKYYDNTVIVVETVLGTNNNEITTWYPLKANEIDKRKGLLLKKRKV